ncbi:hypothetical protein SEPCBS57363_004548 [Sporothrix epigloea]|uniref:CCHC-type domain-containing protein n=1 Tax=Sporothrix epigloea TaxID=1892477 RepID=A0ABP0DVI8_9PEZI
MRSDTLADRPSQDVFDKLANMIAAMDRKFETKFDALQSEICLSGRCRRWTKAGHQMGLHFSLCRYLRRPEASPMLFGGDYRSKWHHFVLPFIPDGSRKKLSDWAQQATYIAEKHWAGFRTSQIAAQREVQPHLVPGLGPPASTSTQTNPDVAINDADAYYAPDIFRIETKRDRCYNCGEHGHWSNTCPSPKRLPPSPVRDSHRQPPPALRRQPGYGAVRTAPTRSSNQSSRRPMPIANRTVKVTRGTLYNVRDDNDLPGYEQDDARVAADDSSDSDGQEVVDILADESTEQDYLADTVQSAEE